MFASQNGGKLCQWWQNLFRRVRAICAEDIHKNYLLKCCEISLAFEWIKASSEKRVQWSNFQPPRAEVLCDNVWKYHNKTFSILVMERT